MSRRHEIALRSGASVWPSAERCVSFENYSPSFRKQTDNSGNAKYKGIGNKQFKLK